jgi:hypothetical protein
MMIDEWHAIIDVDQIAGARTTQPRRPSTAPIFAVPHAKKPFPREDAML